MAKVLLLGWDAADWQVIHPLLDRGEMPHLSRLIERGVMGDISTLEPVLSPMLWNSIATGKRADKHGILGFVEPDPHTGIVRPVLSSSRRCKALWNILAQSGRRAIALNWFASHPAEPVLGGVIVAETFARECHRPGGLRPVGPGMVHPPSLAEALAELRFRAGEVDIETLALFVPRLREIDQDKEKSLPVIAKQIAEMVTIHNAATYLAEHEPWDLLAVYQGAIDHFSHGFMHFHPPRQPWVSERAFELYHDVVNSAYRFHDLMLGRMVELAGAQATVILVSDHGFHSGVGRASSLPRIHAGPALQHRSQGIFVMAGPGVRRDERIYGAGLLDIAPTVLSVLGLPVGQDMEGRVLAEAFDTPLIPKIIPSWEAVSGEDGMHAAAAQMSQDEAQALLQQFVDLGYIDAPSPDKAKATAAAIREQKWNLARVHLSVGRLTEAALLLTDIVTESPERGDFAASLAHCQARLGLYEEAEQTIELMIAEHRDLPAARAVLGQVARARGNPAAALEHLLVAAKSPDAPPDLHLAIARAHTALQQWEEAARSYEQMTALEPEQGLAHQGMAFVRLRQRRWEEAAASALEAIGCQFHLPLSHYYLGCALVRLGIRDRAIQAFEVSVAQQPPVWQAHRWLSILLAGAEGRRSEALRHRHLLETAKARRAVHDQERKSSREIMRQNFRARRQEAAASSKAISTPAEPREVTSDQEPLAVTTCQSQASPAPALDLLLVSGLPRSGTSLMMQILAAGGWPLLTDAVRSADEDNPEGYYEWELARQLRNQPDLIHHAAGKVLKAVSLLLPTLPQQHHYRVIFMVRPIEQIARSQMDMIARRTGVADRNGMDHAAMVSRLRQHLAWTRDYLRDTKNFTVLEVDYPELIATPLLWLARIAAFAGRTDLSCETLRSMQEVVRPELHRRRG